MPGSRDDNVPDEERRRIHKPKGVEKSWRKGTGRWRFSGDAEQDGSARTKHNPRHMPLVRPEDERNALVIETGGPLVTILDGEEELRAQPRRSTTTENPRSTLVCIGDRVRYVQAGEGEALITHVYVRRSALARSAVASRDFSQVLVANIDCVVVTAAATAELLRPGLIDRYIVAAAMGGLEAIVCVNKMDLVDDQDLPAVREIADAYGAAGYDVVLTSCVTGEGVEELHAHMRDRLSAFSGHSGVGKTSLLRQLVPDVSAKVREVSEQSGRGMHTTTHSTLYELPNGGYVADTPGIREFGLSYDVEDLHRYYPEFMEVANACRFPSCTHVHEPGCAVVQAVEDGEISALRYRNYLQIRGSAEG